MKLLRWITYLRRLGVHGTLRWKLIGTIYQRPPDRVINNGYLLRWYVIPRNPIFNIYLHKFMADDDDRALHDHPWVSLSCLIEGSLVEHTPKGRRLIREGQWVWRWPLTAHRIQVASYVRAGRIARKEAWTLFITGPRLRVWGFHTPSGWVPWTKYVNDDGVTPGNARKG